MGESPTGMVLIGTNFPTISFPTTLCAKTDTQLTGSCKSSTVESQGYKLDNLSRYFVNPTIPPIIKIGGN